MDLWLRDPKTGKKSATLSMLFGGFAILTFKILVSSLSIKMGDFSIAFEAFSGSDYAMAMGALGGIYGWRKMQEGKKPEVDDPDERTM